MFDTNVVFKHNPAVDPFAHLCAEVQQWKNELASKVLGFYFALSSVVLLE